MASTCDICAKRPGFGHAISRLGKNALKRHIKSRTKRRFNPNIQTVRTSINGTPKRMNVCTSCIKAGKVARVA